MRDDGRPMPLSELPAYLDSVRERGQGDDVPVVDMGMIVDSRPMFGRLAVVAATALVFAALGAATVTYRTENITIASDADPKAVARMVSDEGGNVLSVSRREDGEYELRVFSFRDSGSLLERLRRNKEIKRADLSD